MSSPGSDAVRMTARGGFVWGVLTLILGILAIAAPLFSGLTVATFLALVLVAAGIAQTLFAFKAGSFGEGFFTFMFGLFTLLAGAAMLARPLVGLASITIVLAVYFFVDGVFGAINSFRLRPVAGWGWMLFSGIVSVILGIMILNDWPASGAWLVGTLVGVRLIFAGWSMIALGGVGEAVADEVDAHPR